MQFHGPSLPFAQRDVPLPIRKNTLRRGTNVVTIGLELRNRESAVCVRIYGMRGASIGRLIRDTGMRSGLVVRSDDYAAERRSSFGLLRGGQNAKRRNQCHCRYCKKNERAFHRLRLLAYTG